MAARFLRTTCFGIGRRCWARGGVRLYTVQAGPGSAADVAAFASLEPHPRSVQYLMSTVDVSKIWAFLSTELPIRYAERIRSLEQVPHWEEVPDLVEVRDIHLDSFKAVREAQVETFAQVAHEAILREQRVVDMMAKSMHYLRRDHGDVITEDFVSKFLDDFLLNRIGCQVLLGHFLACRAGQKSGIIDPRCNTKKVCRAGAKAVLEMCVSCTGLCPNVFVDAYSACGNGLDDDDTPRFPYMPHILKYIVMELLKNSCRATVDMLRAGQLHADDYPINVIVCADEDHVTICVADQARGIPRGVNAWSYLYTTAREGEYGGEKRLAGHGVGLPLSRLYARYLGGALDLVSLPGYGTHAYVNLPRVQTQQVEVVPASQLGLAALPLLRFKKDETDIKVQSSHPEGGQCALEQARSSYAIQLRDAAFATKMLWIVATRYYAPRRWEAYASLFETLTQLECFAAFRGCFPGGVEQEAVTVLPVCIAFRQEAQTVFKLDAYLRDATIQLGKDFLRSEEDLIALKHPCFETDDLANFVSHDMFRRQALLPASNLFGSYEGPLEGLPGLENPQLRAFWMPRWTAPEMHTFGACSAKGSLKWYSSFEPPIIPDSLPAEWEAKWVANLGAGDGTCAQDIVRQDNLERGFLGYADPANCMVRKGYGGVLFEGDSQHQPALEEMLVNRTDLELGIGFVDPLMAAQRIAEFRDARAPKSSPQLLKVDVDNCDCCFVEAILAAGLRPLMIHVEVSPLVPPPIIYRPAEFNADVEDSMESL
ncbi:unnamed protein product, partial [Effrenium voratum]